MYQTVKRRRIEAREEQSEDVMMAPNENGIDDSLYSRQRYVLGDRAMKTMAASKVLLCGLGGLGVEIAKNVCLAGVKQLSLYDPTPATIWDLSTQFYLSEKDVVAGKSRAEACLDKIIELNSYVKVDVCTENVSSSPDWLVSEGYSLVIMVDCHIREEKLVNEFCRNHQIRFISGSVRGLFAKVFVDFGEQFEVYDHDGEQAVEVLISNITQSNPAVVSAVYGRHGLDSGTHVRIKDVKGMTELNGRLFKITVINAEKFSIDCDTSNMPKFEPSNPMAIEEKQPRQMVFRSLSEELPKPTIVEGDWAKLDHPANLHVAFQALSKFQEKHAGTLPRPWHEEDFEEVLQLSRDINSDVQLVDELKHDLYRAFAFTCRGAVSPITSFVGGAVAQEALKAISGKFSPLHQWFYFDAIELLPKDFGAPEFDAAPFLPKNDRYDGERICIGEKLCSDLRNARIFMVGCGAIGCEMMKNFALTGSACGEKGIITVADNDHIEKSNLNRQFLFRAKDIGSPKSKAAASAALLMNKDMRIRAVMDKVCPETEEKFNDSFFQRQVAVVNALDNVQARLYVDSRCVTNQKPLLESGTLGTKGHVQVVVPHLTESYGSTRDPPQASIPICTLKSFPATIEHCIAWAREMAFEETFVRKPEEFNKLKIVASLMSKLAGPDQDVDPCLLMVSRTVKWRPRSYNDCIRYAARKFQRAFDHSVRDLLYQFPVDHINADGDLFWAAPRRAPSPVELDPHDTSHQSFVVTFANMWSRVWGLKPEVLSPKEVAALLKECILPQWRPSKKSIETDESLSKKEVEDKKGNDPTGMDKYRSVVRDFFEQHPPEIIDDMVPEEFEKDNDANDHINFIAAAANLRARVYGIDEVDRLEVKRIAGRIIPAIATTTAAVSGLAILELLKVMQNQPVENYKNAFMNIALPLFTFSEPAPAQKKEICKGVTVSIWDKWEIKKGVSTLQDMVDYFKKNYNLTVNGVFRDAKMVYVDMFPHHQSRLQQKIRELVPKDSPKAKYVDLLVSFTNANGEEVCDAPVVRYYYRKARKPGKAGAK